jgi:hypothetical protein
VQWAHNPSKGCETSALRAPEGPSGSG